MAYLHLRRTIRKRQSISKFVKLQSMFPSHFRCSASLSSTFVRLQAVLCSTIACAALRFFFGVWSGSMALAESRPVDVCLEIIYGLNSGVILSTLLHLPYPDRGVVWRSVQSVFTRLFTPLVLLFCPPRICAFACQPITEVWTVFPPDGMRIDYEGALSRRLHAST